VECWTPSTGDIAGIKRSTFTGSKVPCLVSKAAVRRDGKVVRKTNYTVEAISLESAGEEKTWIGINQVAANRCPFSHPSWIDKALL
jgi:hypothetical protein